MLSVLQVWGWSWASWHINCVPYAFYKEHSILLKGSIPIPRCHGAVPENQLEGFYAWTRRDTTFPKSHEDLVGQVALPTSATLILLFY